ncbi:MAG TPA: S8 family serine peptidase [Thermoanaerobaculia bacterium]
MTSVWNKLDSNLLAIYSDYLYERTHGVPPVARLHPLVPVDGRVTVGLWYAGDVAEIEPLGFQVFASSPEERRASGLVDLAGLERLTAHPGVLAICRGEQPRPTLDTSVRHINVRDDIWKVDAGGAFTGSVTGKKTIIGIIDTGIDYTHPYFRRTSSSTETRILRIWDQGLEKKAGESAPGGFTYGVEYTDTKLHEALRESDRKRSIDRRKVRHVDRVGHGTNIASVAAGNGGPESRRQFAGVAPEAELVVVKYLVETAPRGISDDQRLRDAVNYILRVAAEAVKPVVINISFGNEMVPHDGRTPIETFLAEKFAGKRGIACVVAAGNSAGISQRRNLDPKRTDRKQIFAANQHAALTFGPGETTIEVPLELFVPHPYKEPTAPVRVEIYYPKDKTLATTIVWPKLGDKTKRDTNLLSFGSHIGDDVHGYPFTLRNRRGDLATDGVHRYNVFELQINPKRKGQYLEGDFTLRLKGDGMMAHLYCSQQGAHFRVRDSSPPATGVDVRERFLITEPGGASNVITVAAYNHKLPGAPVAELSSRGPLAKYDGPDRGPKPDLAAPGIGVQVAHSADSDTPNPFGVSKEDGTSIAAPHVAGVVALMFEKNPNLDTGKIIAILHGASKPAGASEDEVGKGHLNAADALKATPAP